jgi:hypothetical protein
MANLNTNTSGKCFDYNQILSLGGSVLENIDGSVSVFLLDENDILAPIALTKTCCEFIRFNYTFDIETQTCKWSTKTTTKECILDETIKLVLNPTGNDGSIFYIDDNENCFVTIDFDYLLKVKCETFSNSLNTEKKETAKKETANTPTTTDKCSKPIDLFESIDVSVTLDVVTSANTLETVFEHKLFPAIGSGNLYSYMINNPNTGFYVCGDPSPSETGFSGCTEITLGGAEIANDNVYSCNSILKAIGTNLFNEYISNNPSGSVPDFISTIKPNALASNWLHYNTTITDPKIIEKIANKKIKISIKVNNSCGDFCVLVDDIVLNKSCDSVKTNEIFLTKSPGFDLDRIIDNKKSWLDNRTRINREFNISNNSGGNPIRQTNYDIDDERLVINSKEIDLDISMASAIENDVWCYVVDNPCLLTGETNCDVCLTACCGDSKISFDNLLTEPVSGITTIEDFKYFLTSELIDVKSRQTLSSYPTLRALYDRYINSNLYCSKISSGFNYLTMEQFANLIGDYWVDIVEQVVPATTIWGSVKIYSNTIFDQQKFKYKSYTSLFCGNPFSGETIPSPINGISGVCTGVSVTTTTVKITNNKEQISREIKGDVLVDSICDSVCIAQMNSGSEFIGIVKIIGSTPAGVFFTRG